MKRINRKPQKANMAKIRDFYNTLDEMFRHDQNDEREEPQRIYREFENTDRFYIQNSIRLNY